MWNPSLAEDIAAQFAMLEGCGGDERDGFKVIETSMRGPPKTKKELKAAHYSRNRDKALAYAKANYERTNARRRERTLKSNIEEWIVNAKMICHGRELDSLQWMQILCFPKADIEREAQKDFVVFLKRCRNVGDAYIAKMLGLSVNDVWAILSERPQK